MPYEFSDEGREMLKSVVEFMDEHIYPNEAQYYKEMDEVGPNGFPPMLNGLKQIAKDRGMWNLFMPDLQPGSVGTRLSNLDYAPVSEQLGKVWFASEVFNSAAPDSGNMEILHHYGSETVKRDWLQPMLEGDIDSAFSMTEPDVASSDAANLELRIERDGADYILNGKKWFSSAAQADRCKVYIVMGKSNPDADRHRQHSMIVVPRDSPGVSFGKEPTVFGYHHRGGHPEIIYDNVRVPADNLLGAEGEGFAISQARLGPGRIHHCMRQIGVAERALELLIRRARERSTFGVRVIDRSQIQQWVAESRIEIDMAREYVYRAAHLMDTVGNRVAATEISGIKVAVPKVVCKVLDRAIQVHGAAGVTQFYPLADMWAIARILRIADGPDEVHEMTIARREIRKYETDFGTTWGLGSSGQDSPVRP